MGDTAENVVTGRHGKKGAPDGGWTLVIHRGDIGLYLQAPDTNYAKYRVIAITARDGTDAALDAAATDAWGDWWATAVLGRDLRDLVRFEMARIVPLDKAIP